jgi:EmrB/QacA subfamily drug resistance transporter
VSKIVSEVTREPDDATIGRPWTVIVLLCLAQFMVILDVTVVNVALPDIGRSLTLGRDVLTWVVAAYTLTFGGLLIAGGRLADALGRRAVFLAGLALFVVASMVAGSATSGGMLLSSRVGQGIGAALLSPAALSILTTEFPGNLRNRALGVWAAIGGGGAAIGVMVGGALTAGPGWRWVFFVNVPVGILVAAAVPKVIPRRPVDARTGVDVFGALTGIIAVTLLIAGVIRAGDGGWLSARTLVPVGLAVLFAIGFMLVERAAATPLVPLVLLRRGAMPGAIVAILGATALLLSAFFLNSLYLQDLRRADPMRTGLVFLPVAVAAIVGAHVSSLLVARVSPKLLAAAGFAIAAVGLLLLATLGAGAGLYSGLMPRFVLVAVGLGAVFVTATTSGLASVDRQLAGVGSGILNTGHEIGGSLGIAAASTIAAPSLVAATGSVTGFHHAFLAAAIAGVAFAVVAATMLPPTPPSVGDGPMFLH